MRKAFYRLPLAIAVAGQFLPVSAQAQEQTGVLEEVLVTAEKREQSIQEVPVAVTAFDRDLQDELGIRGAAEIALRTPSTTYNTNPNRLSIRGIGRVENSLGSDPGVAIYQDGIYTNEIGALTDSSFMIERVEVLRGPQGTLYGRNAIGGAVNFFSRRPTEEFEGEVRAGAYSFEGTQVGLALSGPINDRIRYRIAGEVDQNDGWVENIAGPDIMNRDYQMWEAQLDIDITERLNLWARYYETETDQFYNGEIMISPYNTVSPGPLVGDFFTDFEQIVPNAQFGYDVANPSASDIHKVNWDDPGLTATEYKQAAMHLTYDFDQWQLKYIYGYADYDFDFLGDLDRTARSDIQYQTFLGQFEETEQHEIQLISNLGGDIEFIFGLFNFESENSQPLRADVLNGNLFETPVIVDATGAFCGCILDAPPNATNSYYQQTGDLDTEARAAYMQVDYQFTPELAMTVGLRYSEDEKTGRESQRVLFDDQGVYSAIFGFLGLPWLNVNTPTPGPQSRIAWDLSFGGGSAEFSDKWTSTDGSLGLNYTVNEDTLVYGKVSTGYKSGGFRLGALQPDPTVDEESVISWEAGVKTTFDRALLNVAAYYYDYEDMQVPVNAFLNGINNQLFINAESANQWGLEFEGQWAATDALTFYASYSYMNTEIDTMGQLVNDSTAAVPVSSDLAGNELIRAPEHQFSVFADYTWQVPGGALKFVTSYAYTHEQWSSIFNRPDTQVPSFDRTDFRLSYLADESDLRVTAYVRNAFDEDIIESQTRSSAYFNNQISASIQPPRIVGVEVNYGF